MRIGVDARLLLHKLRGIGSYIHNVLEGILKIDSRNQYYLYVNGCSPYNLVQLEKNEILKSLASFRNVNIVPINSKYEFLWEQFLLPAQAKSDKLDILHMTANRAPFRPPCKLIVTVHDMIEILFFDKMYRTLKGIRGRFYDLRAGLYIKFLYYNVFKKADAVITVSDYSKNDITKIAGVNPDKIKVIHNGYNTEFEFKNLPRDTFVFAFGNGADHKNCPAMIKAYTLLPDSLKKKHNLLIAGKIPELEKLALDLGEKNIIFKDFLPKDTLIKTYNQALCFLFLSSYEGFGIPLLEAMACGVPVVASNKSSIPEILGGSGIIVDPSDIKAISSAIEKVLTDEKARKQMADKGFERVKNFSWEISAKKHLDLYNSI